MVEAEAVMTKSANLTITKFTADRPDSDGTMSTEAALLLRNPTAEPVRWFRVSAVVLDQRGFPLGCSNDNSEDCSIDPGGELPYRLWIGSVSGGAPKKQPDGLALRASVTMYAREFFKLCELDMPTKDLAPVTVEKAVQSGVIEGPVRALVLRERPDEDGDTCLTYRVSLRNTSALHLARVSLKVVVLDSEDSPVTDSDCDEEIAAGAVRCIEGSTSRLKPSQYRGARVRVTLAVFRPVHAETCSAARDPSHA